MKLQKVNFNAYKSLLDVKLDLVKDCIGFVGINESGKSNILNAINVLSGSRQLHKKDKPKMSPSSNPKLTFYFELSEKDKEEVINLINSFSKSHSPISAELKEVNKNCNYVVELIDGKEYRNFKLKGFQLENGHYVLEPEYWGSSLSIYYDGNQYDINKSLIIDQEVLDYNKKIYKAYREIKELKSSFEKKKGQEQLEISMSPEELNDSELKSISKKYHERISDIDGVEIDKIGESLTNEINTKKKQIDNKRQQIEGGSLNESQLKDAKSKLNELERENEELVNNLQLLETPFDEFYSQDWDLINHHFQGEINDILEDLLPNVTFWEHRDNYVLQSKYEFDEIKDKESLRDLSRPLVNIFRLTTNIQDISDLKSKIENIQENGNERSRLAVQMTKKANRYIKEIWKDYDQDLHIAIEKERIRFEITDSEYQDAHYYNMEERSQGCKTFISFLLTIGAEAKKGVIQNSILLLDEPEAHLHPKGARFLLEELIKIASRNRNIVLYATHSEDMIDKKDYERHIIVKKEKERTALKQSKKNRVGYFMQEEVLFSALDIDISNEVASEAPNNFVFEGDGDVKIFEHYYHEVMKYDGNPTRPFKLKDSEFYQGGKCSDIRNYFVQRPIQLGTKWIFIIDKDQPANSLSDFLKAKYKPYIDQDIFIFQYPTELEDLLPNSLLLKSYELTFESRGIECDSSEELANLIEKHQYEEYEKSIMEKYVLENKKDFKGEFKGNLNSLLGEKLVKAKSEEEFTQEFPKYSEWVKSKMDILREL